MAFEPEASLEQDFWNQQKDIHGRSATFMWLGLGALAFALDPSARFFSWQAAVFFIVGMFVAAVVFGLIGYGLQRLVAQLLIAANAGERTVKTIGAIMLLVDVALIWFTARALVRWMF